MSELEPAGENKKAISRLFGERLAASHSFHKLFQDGMALMAAASAYLDGPGRADSRRLPAAKALLYATESMRLTTRLMQLASWLLLRRAMNEGSITAEQASASRARVDLNRLAAFSSEIKLAALPPALADLIEKSIELTMRVRQMDLAIHGHGDKDPKAKRSDNQVERYQDDIRKAFQVRL